MPPGHYPGPAPSGTQLQNILLYSHDTFGLGHLRRNRKIADAIRQANQGARITLATGSDIAGKFPPINGVQLVRLPPVSKTRDGTYVSPDGHETLDHLIERRAAILSKTVLDQKPDIFIADKEPFGLLGELEQALALLPENTLRILGLREVLDDRDTLRAEWEKHAVTKRLPGLYDEIWIYGPDWFHNPLEGLDLPVSLMESCTYLGFLGIRASNSGGQPSKTAPKNDDPYILVTAGGGEDGWELMRQVLAACQAGLPISRKLYLLPGPLMDKTALATIRDMAAGIAGTKVLDFHPDPSALISEAEAVVSMCGYNTFCEVLEAGKPALFIPREVPRREQLIRANRAADLKAASVMRASDANDAEKLARRINTLPEGPKPADASQKFEFDGLTRIGRRIAEIFQKRQPSRAI